MSVSAPPSRRALAQLELADAVRFGLTAAWCALLFLVFAPLALVWPTLAWRNRLSLVAGRLLSRFALRLWGVRARYEGLEHLRAPAILTFNHTSALDFLLLAPLAGSRALVFGKRELARVPLLGWAWLLGGHPLIRREERGHWEGELDRVARLVREQRYSAVIAPEGTRSRSGALLPFKKGAFHLALETRRPIVPVVIEGGHERLRGAFPTAGPVRVRVLPPLDTRRWRRADLERHVAALRARYLGALAERELQSTSA